MSADVELDCRDLPCPRPIIELAKALPGVPVGGLLAVVARDPAARYDVPAWCRMRGQEYVGEEAADDGAPRYVVKRLS
ncbi:tRNA 2-thiouridine synthesizing protein A/cysteine desulfurase [Nocardioides sp. J9]|uniref:sulfurtransferase TusA family protein n=1 Tax=unclassified Nocardioides TaxID=2615069 RepID=UPI00048C566E|nr:MULTISPECIES: sulfurtransferase TusA family protein [unclassified Nocardioides]TWG89877.1 tRNA 2-thiouridine synthesizing protein A/cysteine desulfurase [Nocardioides sp. J9]